MHFAGHDLTAMTPERTPPGVGRRAEHDLPGSDDRPQPGQAHRQADHRVAPPPPGHGPVGGQGQRRRAAPLGGHPLPRGADPLVPVPAVGGHAPAGHDRHRPGLRPAAGHGRRADHRPRRHRAGPDPRPAGRPPARAAHGGDPGHPRPRGGGQPGRRDRGHVRRADRRTGPDPHPVPRHPHALHPGPDGLHPPAVRPERDPAARHRRPAPGPDPPADGLPVRPPLPLRPGQVPGERSPAPHRRLARPPLRLLVPPGQRRLHRARPTVSAPGPGSPSGGRGVPGRRRSGLRGGAPTGSTGRSGDRLRIADATARERSAPGHPEATAHRAATDARRRDVRPRGGQPGRRVPERAPDRARRVRRHLLGQGRRDPGPGGRVGMREVDHRPRPGAGPAADVGSRSPTGVRT